MDNGQKAFILQNSSLFSELPLSSLLIIAEEIETVEMKKSSDIFLENDPPTGLYIIAEGGVAIKRGKRKLAELKKYDVFGELALIDNSPRTATATPSSDGLLLYMDKYVFESITSDFPEALRAVTRKVLQYLKSPDTAKNRE